MSQHDVIIIGAGFSGMYQLYTLRDQLGFDALVIEAGDDVGGTWYWNRYPGARVDIQSIEYSYSFSEELQQEWDWTERYSAQPEIRAYAEHVADRFDLRRDILFGTRVTALDWDESATEWTVTTTGGQTRTARFVIAATGCLSVPSRPRFAGMDDFEGDLYWTSEYPQGTDLSGKRVAVIGTGSSGLQVITAVAPEVADLTVFQRTPSYAIPAHNEPADARLAAVRPDYESFREASRASLLGFQCVEGAIPVLELTEDAARVELDSAWAEGGLCLNTRFPDAGTDPAANAVVAEYARGQIRAKVTDPVVAEKLSPRTYPIGSKRMCVDTGYYETYNRPNVHLVDLRETPIERFTPTGIATMSGDYAFDVIIMATGFDAMTGALNAIDIRAGGQRLADKWAHGPRTYLGLMSHGFPNLFTVTGPQSPSVLSNMMTSIEFHVEWIADTLKYLRENDIQRIEPDLDAEDNWVRTNNDLANLTLMPQAASWYMGANIPGKEQVFLPFVGGVGLYRQVVQGITLNHHGFELA